MAEVESEQVLVVPTELLHRLGYFQGFTAEVDRYLAELLSPAHTAYRPRGAMERDPRYKQLIPYVIFRLRDDLGGTHLFHYRRGKGQGERRLHSKRSIGIGGHISLDDEAARGNGHSYLEGMRREIAEEVALRTPYSQRLVGLLNDDKTDVGRVHLGVVHVCDVITPDVTPREPDIQEAGFQAVDALLQAVDDFESWSQICLEALFAEGKGILRH